MNHFDKKCECKKPTEGRIAISMLGAGCTIYCRKCNGVIRDHVPSNGVPEAKAFWERFDPDNF